MYVLFGEENIIQNATYLTREKEEEKGIKHSQ